MKLLKDLNVEHSLDYVALAIGAIGGVSFALISAALHAVSSVLLSTMGTALNNIKQGEGMYETSYIDKTPSQSIMSVVDIVWPSDLVRATREKYSTLKAKSMAKIKRLLSLGGAVEAPEEPPKTGEDGGTCTSTEKVVPSEEDAANETVVPTPSEVQAK